MNRKLNFYHFKVSKMILKSLSTDVNQTIVCFLPKIRGKTSEIATSRESLLPKIILAIT